MRFKTGDIELQRDEAWRSRMQPADRRMTSVLTWPLLKRYGY